MENSIDSNKSEHRRWDESRGATRVEDESVKATVKPTMSSGEDSSSSESDSMIADRDDERASYADELSINNKVALGSSTPFTPMTKICSSALDQLVERANVNNGKSTVSAFLCLFLSCLYASKMNLKSVEN